MRSILTIAGMTIALVSNPVTAQEQSEPETESEKAAETKPLDFTDFGFLKLLEKLPAPNPPEQEFDTSKPVVGFGISRAADGMKIDFVLEGSAAEIAGLEEGMVILRINGITLKEFETADVTKILGAIDGEITFDIERQGRYSLIKAPIPPQDVEE